MDRDREEGEDTRVHDPHRRHRHWPWVRTIIHTPINTAISESQSANRRIGGQDQRSTPERKAKKVDEAEER